MKIPPLRISRPWLAPVVIAALVLAWFVVPDAPRLVGPGPDVEPPAAPPVAAGPVPAAPDSAPAAPKAPPAPDGSAAGPAPAAAEAAPVAAVTDIFGVRTWEPPPPPPDANPPPPQAPPLPFKFLGRIVEPGRAVAFLLADGARVHVVGVGDRIGGDYRIEKYENGQLLIRYRPMNLRQALAVGGPS